VEGQRGGGKKKISSEKTSEKEGPKRGLLKKKPENLTRGSRGKGKGIQSTKKGGEKGSNGGIQGPDRKNFGGKEGLCLKRERFTQRWRRGGGATKHG